jgi:predicted dehydrogenase
VPSGSTIRVGIIGCGVIGPVHAECYQLLPGVELAWACDLVEAKARRLAEKMTIPRVTADYREVLADPRLDAISVCTDHASHVPITVAALEAGKHVLCEKALAPDAAGLDVMMAARRRHPELCFAGVFQHRFDPGIRTIKRLADEGAFGRLLAGGVQVRCHRSKEYYEADQWRGTWAGEGGGVLINQAIHGIDSISWIMGGAEAVCGAHANLTHDGVMETEDTAVAAVHYRDGAAGTIEATCSSHLGWELTLSLHGSQGSVELRSGELLKLQFVDAALTARVQAELAGGRNQMRVASARTHYGTSHPLQIADFVEAIRQGRPPFVSGQQARHAVDIVLAIYESQRRRGWVEVGG